MKKYVILLLMLASCKSVDAGNVAVQDLFGDVSSDTMPPGLHWCGFFTSCVEMSVKTQEQKEEMQVTSKEGLTVNLEVSAIYHLNPSKVVDMYKTVGERYQIVILDPQFRSITRIATGEFEAKALYTQDRERLAKVILDELTKAVGPRGIEIENVLLRNVQLPKSLSESIESKLKMEQESQRMQFVLQKERQEAERKSVEARGIADFQRIVAQGISSQLLQWKGIEATEKLAASTNAKFVIIGGKDGLPVILDSK